MRKKIIEIVKELCIINNNSFTEPIRHGIIPTQSSQRGYTMKQGEGVIAIYSRKSKFTGKGESIGNQVELCREYIRLHYGEQAAEEAVVFEDEGFSGGNLNRPDFKRMMQDAHDRKIIAIVVYRLDRISRNISDFSSLIEELSRLQVDFVSIREQFDTASPMGRAMMYISSVFSQLERETIAERIRDNMHELAKTGRWLGGTTPTGYASESVKTVTVDGKSKKACKLTLIPEEAKLVRQIFDRFLATDSLTVVETELLQQHVKTKTGRDFTRFAIKNILQNPVYLIADADAYQYFSDKQAELFSEQSGFDGVSGILAYNRTDQEKGRSTIYLPVNEWIISVGQHPGLIPGREWIKVQASLERNRSKSYRKPRSNEALLTGLIFCRCGSRMYPKLTKRVTADGQPVYSYLCKLKEHSRGSRCKLRNANGNLLDAELLDQIKQLGEDDSTFLSQLEKSKKFYAGSRDGSESRLNELQKEKAETDKKIAGLVDSLADLPDSTARKPIASRIEELSRASEELAARIAEWESLTEQHRLSDIEFDLLRQLLVNFHDSIDSMSVEQKRSAVRSLVRRVVWDGEYAHVFLFGAQGNDIEYPPLFPAAADESNEEEDRLGKRQPPGARNARWGEDSIFYTFRCISCESGVFLGPEAADSLDQTDGADGNQIVLLAVLRIVFLHNVRHQAEIVLDQHVARGNVPCRKAFQTVPFLLRRKGFRKRSRAARQMQGQQQAVRQQIDCRG